VRSLWKWDPPRPGQEYMVDAAIAVSTMLLSCALDPWEREAMTRGVTGSVARRESRTDARRPEDSRAAPG
jgi:hypothetical protein